MAKVVLLKDIDKLGTVGKIVDVKDGYARHLISSGKAVVANQNEIQKSKDRKSSEEYAELLDKKESERIFGLINDQIVDVSVKAGDNGKLLESVTNAKISDLMKSKFAVEIPKNKIKIENNDNRIYSFGAHDVSVHLFKDIIANVRVNVVQENI